MGGAAKTSPRSAAGGDRGRGRPSKLTPELRDELAASIRAGNTVEVAVRAVGIGERTFHEWMGRGRSRAKREARFREFRVAVERARDECEASLVASIARAAERGSWAAAAFLLRNRFPERWGSGSDDREAPAAPAPEPEEDRFSDVDSGKVTSLTSRRRSRSR